MSPAPQPHIPEVEAWFATTGDREPDLRAVDALIREHAPHLRPAMSGDMIGYGLIDYRPRSAKETRQLPILSLANQKRHMSLYACAVIDGEYVAELYADRLGSVSCGKSCIRFTRADRLDQAGLAEMLATIDERYARGDTLYG
ncbi:DUF1801 domain-containing protein [Nostocoides sp. F2B08]|uniref:DUF1801 domain-containing protein n=1 Tax=Nostocoides sp. F2B08 TaxID=2653936 RepID=UPI0012638510|nr:DUF1801 domain-containing protein [Tetrasphaera sp. F2B08]KAB7743822.1 DUF1801 domain-containing protein [Tetrasphaera sp. F2B08]